jgi:hypothetical protein
MSLWEVISSIGVPLVARGVAEALKWAVKGYLRRRKDRDRMMVRKRRRRTRRKKLPPPRG